MAGMLNLVTVSIANLLPFLQRRNAKVGMCIPRNIKASDGRKTVLLFSLKFSATSDMQNRKEGMKNCFLSLHNVSFSDF